MGKIIGLTFEPAKTGFACSHCGKKCATQNALDKHISKEHAEGEASEENEE